MAKPLLTKKEETVTELGVQFRDASPPILEPNRLWVNTTTGTLNYFDGVVKTIMPAGYEQGFPLSSFVDVPALAINWSLARGYKKVNLGGGGTTTFTFSNNTDGASIYVLFVAAVVGGGTTLAFPASVKKATPDSFVLANGDAVVIKFTQLGSNIYAEVLYRAVIGEWPSGAGGNLTINNGQTVNLAAGSIYDYNNVTINTGGTLNITGNSNDVMILGVFGNFVCNGQIIGRYFGVGGSFSKVAPDGFSLSHTITQANGGTGGPTRIHRTSPPSVIYSIQTNGGAGTNGFGGGGAGGTVVYPFYAPTQTVATPGNYPLAVPGGVGGANNGNGSTGSASRGHTSPEGYGVAGTGGVGNSTLGNGSTGQNATSSKGGNGGSGGGSGGGGGAGYIWNAIAQNRSHGGGGGGGGYKGRHGLSLYIRVLGNYSGTGSINLNGLNGNNGGAGGNFNTNGGFISCTGGGGGAGGAGGSGGRLWVRYSGSYSAVTTNVSAGTGGTGNSGGTNGPTGTLSGSLFTVSNSGGNGSAGTAGSSSATFVAP